MEVGVMRLLMMNKLTLLAQVCDLYVALKKQKILCPCGARHGLHPEASGPRQQKNSYTNKKRLSRQETASFVYRYG